VDTVGNVPELRLRGDVRWSFGGWSANVLANYLASSRDTTTNRSVESWTTFDASLRYQFGAGTAQWLSGISAGLNAVNVLDKRPPFVDRCSGYDDANAREIGRIVSVSLTKSW